jgi:hypothetical protein
MDNSNMKFRVKLQKNQIAEAWVTIDANNDQDAVDGAMAKAGNCKVDWNYVDYDFEVLEVTEITETTPKNTEPNSIKEITPI